MHTYVHKYNIEWTPETSGVHEIENYETIHKAELK